MRLWAQLGLSPPALVQVEVEVQRPLGSLGLGLLPQAPLALPLAEKVVLGLAHSVLHN